MDWEVVKKGKCFGHKEREADYSVINGLRMDVGSASAQLRGSDKVMKSHISLIRRELLLRRQAVKCNPFSL